MRISFLSPLVILFALLAWSLPIIQAQANAVTVAPHAALESGDVTASFIGPSASGFSAASSDPCPTPTVQRIHGPAGGPLGAEAALNSVIELNGVSVRFVEYLPGRGRGSSGGEYTLSGDQSELAVQLTLTDPKGRVVATATAPIQGQMEAEAGLAAAQNISPLLPRIRAHQRRIREEEQSAIFARITATPGSATVGRDEEVDIQLELLDCDETPLSRSPVQIEITGVGRAQPPSVSTDDAGRAKVTFVSNQTGTAAVVPNWSHENTEGVPVVALPEQAVEINVEEGHWTLQAEIEAAGDMTTRGVWDGTFRLVEGNLIEGDGTITTTVTGSCVSGSKAVPMRISGHRDGEMLYVTVVGEDDGSEPTTEQDESMGCAVRTLIELPSFFRGLASFAEMIATNEPCPIRMPAGTDRPITAECAGVTFRIAPAPSG